MLPHRYSGKPMPHYHTSYAALTLVVLVTGLMLVAVSLGVAAGTITNSGDVGFSGIVPGPPPATPPVITSPVNGQRVTSLPVQVQGSCIVAKRVEVLRNGTLAGSAICNAQGRFALAIDLAIGTNSLLARQYDFLDQASPDSAVVSLSYGLPPAVTPTAKPLGTKIVAPTAAPIQPPFSIISSFKGFNLFPDSKMSVPLTIRGGSKPYALYIDWGDSTSSLLSRTEAGSFTVPHTYAAPGAYAVAIKAIDSSQSAAHFQIGLVVSGPVVVPRTVTQPELRLMIAWPIYLVIVVLVFGFWLGERYEAQHLRNKNNLSS